MHVKMSTHLTERGEKNPWVLSFDALICIDDFDQRLEM